MRATCLTKRRSRWRCPVSGFAWILWLATAGSCSREKRELHPPVVPSEDRQVTSLHAGGRLPPPKFPFGYEENAYAVSEGKQLFTDFNCSTCHANGGGDIGPPLKDDRWIYGSDPAQIHDSIVEGRPNGMPSFRRRISENQLWQIVAYIRSLGGLAPGGGAPGRSDETSAGPPPNSIPAQTPQEYGVPKPAEHP
jgi:cytochrome c oxidase cbb3-type subunit 3